MISSLNEKKVKKKQKTKTETISIHIKILKLMIVSLQHNRLTYLIFLFPQSLSQGV